MARRSVRSKAAGSGSTPTTGAPGITIPEISALRASLGASTTSRTSPSQTQMSFEPSRPSGKRDEREPSSSTGSEPTATITVQMPSGDVLTIVAKHVTIDFEREFHDVTTRYDVTKTYVASRGTFTIKGSL